MVALINIKNRSVTNFHPFHGLIISETVRKKTPVAQDISEAYRTKVKENRHYIKTIGEVIMLTVTQGMAQRGHREGHEDVNPGNVRKILQFVAKHDDVIADRIKNGPKN